MAATLTSTAPTCEASITLGPHADLKSVDAHKANIYDIHTDVGEVLFTAQQLADKTAELGRHLGRDYSGKRPLFMPILKGGFICELMLMLQA